MAGSATGKTSMDRFLKATEPPLGKNVTMGSFVDVMLAVKFVPETPPEVIGALHPAPEGQPDAPPLPSLAESIGEEAAEDIDEFVYDLTVESETRVEDLSPIHQACVWAAMFGWGSNAYFPGVSFRAMVWDPIGEAWSLTVRSLPKSIGPGVRDEIACMGRWVGAGTPEQPEFVGYIKDEYTPHPVLIWSVGRQPFRFEGEFNDW